jgi:glycerol-3-phosphate acyltransferase PlsY
VDGVLIALALIAAYVIGSVPSAYIIGRLRKGADIRDLGSRNMGAMNVFYSVGFWWGVLVLALDIGKGAAAVAVADAMGVPELAVFAAGVISVLGHSFPVFLGFRGGKGGATCIGVLFYLMPQAIPIAVGVFALILLLTRYPTVSYSVGLLTFPFAGRLMYERWELTLFSVVLLLVPFIRYLPRLREMRSRAGNWGHVFKRRGLGDRL